MPKTARRPRTWRDYVRRIPRMVYRNIPRTVPIVVAPQTPQIRQPQWFDRTKRKRPRWTNARVGRWRRPKVYQMSAKKKLHSWGVGAVQSQYRVTSSFERCANLVNSRVKWCYLKYGLHDKLTLDGIYTAQSLSDADECTIILNQKIEYTLRNQSDSPQWYTFYTAYIRQDIESSLNTFFDACFNDINAISGDEQYHMTHPGPSPRFKRHLKVVRRVSFELSPGDQKVITIKHSKPVKKTYAYKRNADAEYIKGSTISFFSCKGAVVHDSTNKSSEVGTAKTYTDVVMTKKVVYRQPPANRVVSYDDTTGLQETFSNAAVGVVDEDFALDQTES